MAKRVLVKAGKNGIKTELVEIANRDRESTNIVLRLRPGYAHLLRILRDSSRLRPLRWDQIVNAIKKHTGVKLSKFSLPTSMEELQHIVARTGKARINLTFVDTDAYYGLEITGEHLA